MKAIHRSWLLIGILLTAIAPVAAAAPPQSPINNPKKLLVTGIGDIIYNNYGAVAAGLQVKNEGSADADAVEKSMKVTGFAAGAGLAHTVTVDGTTYELQNIHWHKHSEHHFNNQFFPMEMHMVHKEAGVENYLAIGRWITQRADDDPNLAEIFNNFPASGGTYTTTQQALDLAQLKGPGGNALYYKYSGSLTHPHNGATLPVKWIMYDEPFQLSAAQMNSFGAFFPNNFRPVQATTPAHNLAAMNVPEPGAVTLLAVAGLLAGRRMRRG